MERNCDIVMKGGITSGIVYPAAVCEIAKTFRFKNVGGTSAGAIAAALTAAAERRRARDASDAGFDRLGQIPNWLADENRLFRLFVPNRGTRALFRTIKGLFGRSRGPAWLAKWSGLVRAFPIASLLGAVPGIVFAVAVGRTTAITAWWLLALAALLALLTIVAGITVVVVVALVRDLLGRLPGNCFGMVTGIDDADPTNEIALSTWLAQELELTAGIAPGTDPLTFGMLWDANRDTSLPGLAEKPDDPNVNLEMITTNASWGRPYNFPTTLRSFFFDPAEMRRFFPGHVVNWMIARRRPPKDAAEAVRFQAYAPRLPLPIAADLPVIVATRMSLAFPILLSAVPLWAADFSKPIPAGAPPTLEHCWFSDGGISSNFPVTLFDSALPRWPTFAIDLAPFPEWRKRDPEDESKNVMMPASNAAGRLATFARFPDVSGFLSGIFNAMQNWNDTTQAALPGYRDRIVTVFLDRDEGGLNLDMPSEVLHRLRARGAAAGTLIAQRFEAPSDLGPATGAMNWENHRWLRLRSTFQALRDYLTHFEHATSVPQAPDVTYSALIDATSGLPTKRYPLRAGDRPTVSTLSHDLAALGLRMEQTPGIDDDMPNPPGRLVVRPDLRT
ncbi:MAG: RpoH suppressor SuhR [Candidatus Elarobacter sp.]